MTILITLRLQMGCIGGIFITGILHWAGRGEFLTLITGIPGGHVLHIILLASGKCSRIITNIPNRKTSTKRRSEPTINLYHMGQLPQIRSKFWPESKSGTSLVNELLQNVKEQFVLVSCNNKITDRFTMPSTALMTALHIVHVYLDFSVMSTSANKHQIITFLLTI